MKYRICNFCVMDTSDREIVFDEKGICNHCKSAKIKLEQIKKRKEQFDLSTYMSNIKKEGSGKKYDCIVGISGGVDSCYVMHLVKQYGLRPLAVHIDNCWNSKYAENNIRTIVDKLGIDLYTQKVNWDEFRELQLAFLKASTPDSEIPTDHTLFPILGMIAHKHHCKYIIMGHNSSSESILPRTWSYGHFDWKYIKSVNRQFGKGRLKSYPHFTRPDHDYFMRKYEWFNILDYIDYNKEEAKQYLIENYGWKDYGGKHQESFYTKFYQTYILPVKFGYDKRRAHLSSLIVAGQMTRENALKILEEKPYDEVTIDEDIKYFSDKMEISIEEFENIMQLPVKSYWDYPSNENDFMGKVIQKLSKIFNSSK